jgi:flagellar hook-length control protein FliK
MSSSPIAPSQPAATTRANAPSSASGSEADFGPILQAASAAPADAAAPRATPPAVRGRSGGAQQQDDGADAGADQAQAKPGSTAARRSGRSQADPAPQSGAQAAAAAAGAVASVVPARSDAATADQTLATTLAAAIDRASRDPTRAGGAAVESSLPVAGGPIDDARLAQAVAADAAAAASRPVLGTQTPTRSDRYTALAQPSSPDVGTPRNDRAITADAARTAALDQDAAAASAAGQMSGADSDARSGSAAAGASESTLSTGQGVQAIAQALASTIQQAASSATDSASPQPGASSAVVPAADPASTAAATASGAFGTVTSYTPEGQASVETPVGQPGFGQELSERVLVLARGGVQSAQISLDPAGLGPVGVSIQVHGHAATLAFSAAHETTRNALEAALPRLREMFASCGMQLSDATVGGRAQPDGSPPQHAQTANWQRADDGDGTVALPSPEPAATAPAAALRLVDIYA